MIGEVDYSNLLGEVDDDGVVIQKCIPKSENCIRLSMMPFSSTNIKQMPFPKKSVLQCPSINALFNMPFYKHPLERALQNAIQ